MRTAFAERMCRILDRDLGAVVEEIAKLHDARLKRLAALGGNRNEERARRCLRRHDGVLCARLGLRRGFEDHVRVRAADPERVHGNQTAALGVELLDAIGDAQAKRVETEIFSRRLDGRRGNGSVTKDGERLEEARHAGSRLGVTERALHRADGQELSTVLSECERQRERFLAVADLCACTVRLDIGDVVRRDSAFRHDTGDQRSLLIVPWCPGPEGRATTVAGAARTDDAVDAIAIS